MSSVVVIGAGLFGSVIADALTMDGHDVTRIDAGSPGAGSRPAACLMKPSWFSGLGKDVYDPALDLLDEMYGIQDIEFQAGPVRASVHWVDPVKILCNNVVTRGRAVHVDTGAVTVHLLDETGEPVEFGITQLHPDYVVCATGVWAQELGGPEVRGQSGAAFLWREHSIEQPFIRPWAPYRQLVAFNRGDGLWVGDGSAIKPENWTDERQNVSELRCARAVSSELGKAYPEPEVLWGIRPYIRGHRPCYLAEHQPRVWHATGGAKNGTLAAGWCAHRLRQELS